MSHMLKELISLWAVVNHKILHIYPIQHKTYLDFKHTISQAWFLEMKKEHRVLNDHFHREEQGLPWVVFWDQQALVETVVGECQWQYYV